MLISVFTPSHDSRFLGDAYESLVSQSLPDWEWIVLLNKGANWRPPQKTHGFTSAVPPPACAGSAR